VDQRLEGGGSLVFDSPVLDEAVEILGSPVAALRLSADPAQAMVAVCLSDVAPDGTVTLVTFGLLNLNHRDNHTRWETLVPDESNDFQVALNHIAQRSERGHRIRLAVSTSYWPLAWPAPEPATLTVDTSASELRLPVRPPRREDAELPDLGEPRMAPAPATTLLTEPHREWQVHFNLATNEAVLEVIDHDGRLRLEDSGLTLDYKVDERYSYANDDHGSVRGEVTNMRRFERGDWSVSILTSTVLTCQGQSYRLRARVEAFEGDERVFEKSWDELVPREA